MGEEKEDRRGKMQGRTKRVPRRDRFLRIRNKLEPVYRTPAFLKQTIGVTDISESGIFFNGNDYSKVYAGLAEEKAEQLQNKLRQMETEYEIVAVKGKKELQMVIHTEQKDMTDACAWFHDAEQEFLGKGLTAEERLGNYVGFLEEFLTAECNTDSYILNAGQWKTTARLAGLKTSEGELETDAGAYVVLAVRNLSIEYAETFFSKLWDKEGIEEMCISVVPVSDQTVADAIRAEYLGLDGILPRLRRSSPLVYEILSHENEGMGNNRSFARVGIYFLLKATNKEELQSQTENFLAEAEKLEMRIERVPLVEFRSPSELRKTLGMLGMMGTRQQRYQCFVPHAKLAGLLPEQQARMKNEQRYDVEEMRMLFFDREAGK